MKARMPVGEEIAVKTAKDIMQTQIVSVGLDDPLLSVYRLFADEEISGAPVVDESGKVVGVVSIRDLIRATSDEQENSLVDADYFHDGLVNSKESWLMAGEDFEETLSHRVVSDVMTADVISVTPDAPIREIVHRILTDRIHRVLVVDRRGDEDALVGLISLFDLVALLA
jgi:CBS domain-containing protein